jgi:hypothetical protein
LVAAFDVFADHGRTAARSDLPSGTVTFLFTDVEGSTRLLHGLGPEAYAQALAEHRRIVRAAAGEHGGVEVDTQGDAFFLAFPAAPGALAAAHAIRERMAGGAAHPAAHWPAFRHAVPRGGGLRGRRRPPRGLHRRATRRARSRTDQLYGCGGDLNFTRYCNRRLTAVPRRVPATLDAGERARMLNEAEVRYLVEDVPSIPLYATPRLPRSQRRAQRPQAEPDRPGALLERGYLGPLLARLPFGGGIADT